MKGKCFHRCYVHSNFLCHHLSSTSFALKKYLETFGKIRLRKKTKRKNWSDHSKRLGEAFDQWWICGHSQQEQATRLTKYDLLQKTTHKGVKGGRVLLCESSSQFLKKFEKKYFKGLAVLHNLICTTQPQPRDFQLGTLDLGVTSDVFTLELDLNYRAFRFVIVSIGSENFLKKCHFILKSTKLWYLCQG